MKAGALSMLLFLLAAPGTSEIWPKLPPPKPGEWRWRHAEKPQTLDQYKESAPQRAEGKRRVIYVLPAWTRPGPERANGERLDALLAAFFGREVRRLEPRPLPAGAYDRRRRQYEIRALVPFLRRTLPDDGVFLLALTDRGLRLPGARHTDGWGSREWRVGIAGTWRLREDRKPERRKRRYLGLVLHEATHMLSLPHCTERACLMNGAMDWEESDRRPLLLCWECRDKVCWNAALEVKPRYRALSGAWGRAGFPEAVEMIRRVLEGG